MEGKVVGEDEKGLGIRVIDNNSVKHTISVGFDGEIQGHGQDGYPDDPSKRTTEEDESVSQSRRYAKYYVYREKGYDTVPARENPDRLAATIVGLQNLTDEEFEDLFGDYYRQVISYYDPSVEGPINELQYLDDSDDFRVFLLDVYLEQDLEEIREAGETYTDELKAITEDVVEQTTLTGNLCDRLTSFGGKIGSRIQSEDLELPNYTIEAVSDVHMLYTVDKNEERIVEGGWPFKRDPDARMELSPVPMESLEQFRALLVEHLLCQIRDCFVGMGIDPPAPFRVLGPGLHEYSQKYRHFDMYPDYVDPNANIPGFRA